MTRHLFHLFPTFAVGGSQVRLAQLCNHFGERYRHTIFATDGVYDAAALLSPQVAMRKLEVAVDKHRGLRNVPLFRRIYRDVQPDVVVTHNWGTIEWAFATRFATGLSHVHIEDGFGPDEANRQIKRRVMFRKVALTGTRTTVVVPSQVLQQIATRAWKLPAAKVQLIPNGIDLQRFSRVRAEQARTLALKRDGEILIGTVASLRPEKNLGVLIRAFMRISTERPMRLFIVGGGPELPALKSLAEELGAGDRIVFFGHTSQPELILRAFDIFAMSSNTEQMPIGLLEAMACSLPVAATNVGDIANMAAPENSSLITTAGDVDALADSLRKLATDASARERIGARNLAKVAAQYDQSLMFKRYEALFG